MTGAGIKEFFEAVDASRTEYEKYVAWPVSSIYANCYLLQGVPTRA